MLATAVVAAVTTPALLLSVAPAFAADAPPAAGQTQDAKPKPTPAELEKLKKAMDEAKTAYDAAAAKAAAARKYADEYLDPDSPAWKELADARKVAKEAADAVTAADTALQKAKKDLADLAPDAPEADVTKAKDAVKTAQEKYDAAVKAKSEADRTVALTEGNPWKGYMDAKVKAAEAAIAAESAKKAYDDAAKAYEDAKAAAGNPDPTKPPVDPTKPPVDPTKPPVDPTGPPPTEPPVDEDCKVGPELRTALVGLPGKVVAGTTVNFTLRVTNGTGKKVDEVKPFAVVYGHDNKNVDDISKLLHLQAAAAGSDDWKDVKEAEYAGTVTNLDAGKSADLKLRLTVDKKAPAADGIAFAAGDYANEDGSCGGNDLTEYTFSILTAGSDPGKVPDAKPGKVANPADVPVPQGGANATPVTTDAGNLAATGSAGTPQVALAAGSAVVLGAGAMFVVRRRKAGQEA